MLKISFFILMILDGVYQSWGNPHSVNWSLYYDIIHYWFVFSVALYAALNIPSMNGTAYIFMAYFGIVSLKYISFIGMDRAEYINEIASKNPYQVWGIISIIIIIIFTLYQTLKNGRSKK